MAPSESALKTPDQLVQQHGITRVLAFGAHPDDIDFGAAGTIAGLTASGVQVTVCLLTSGDAGGFELGRDSAEMARLREIEQREASALLGVHDVIMLDERDGFVAPTDELVGKIVRVMRQVRPEVVIAPHPERAWDRLQKSHPDHMACGEAVVRAAYPFVENPFAYPELQAAGLEAFKIRHLLLTTAPQHQVNLRLDVTGQEAVKMAALRQHFSQHPDAARMEGFVLDQMRQIHAGDGFAEEFHWVTVNAADTISGF
ncbi:PIG-L deacetylase family protein [Nesterenkonia sp. Act20]|uniref:PIG-L deacetylase family protein n=1 Tax=Nesterenkonia sp. Act20 TaxID=1483432 RepID=UPI00210045B9|nr:PIG-L deacetylase family protein [Nesterenkonia sp. Act20]